MSYASCYEANEFNLPTATNPYPVGSKIVIANPAILAAASIPSGPPGVSTITALIPSGNFILPYGTWVFTGVSQVSVATPGDYLVDTQYRVIYGVGLGNIIAEADNGYNNAAGADLSATPQITGVIVSDGIQVLNISIECDCGAGDWKFADGAATIMTQTLVRIA